MTEREKRREAWKDMREASFFALKEEHDKELQENKNNNFIHAQLKREGYFAQENVKDYQAEMATHLYGDNRLKRKGRGTFFEDADELREWMRDYFALCAKTSVVPTLSGLATWLQCGTEAIRTHGTNPNSPFYDLCRNALNFCHASLEMGATEGKLNSVAYIFQAKNYYDMKDQQEVRVVAHTETEQINSEETLKALMEQQKREEEVNKLLETKEAKFEEVISANL